MAAKTQIVDFLGDKALVLPALLEEAIIANERAKYVLSLLQMAASNADNPQEAAAPWLRSDREVCGITDPAFDRSVAESISDGRGNYQIPGAGRLVGLLDDALSAMLAPLALTASASGQAEDRCADYRRRLERLLGDRPAIIDDIVAGETIASMTSGQPAAGDGFHLLIMDLHKELNHLQADISREEVDGAKAFGIDEADRPLIAAFMRGVNKTAALKFDHPGLTTTAARSSGAVLIQNDLGTTAAHVLVVRISGSDVAVTHTDVHPQRLGFFQSMLGGTGIEWEELHSHHASAISKGDLFYVARGRFAAPDAAAQYRFLEQLGSRLVFLIDWNRARKRLRLLVPNDTATDILRWAADHGYGHRGFLEMGGERLVYEALEQAVKTPLRYGEPLHEMIGSEAARDYLCFVLQTTATGLLKGQSAMLIRDQVRAELFNHFRSAEQRLLTEVSRHAGIIIQLAERLRGALRQGPASQALAQNAAQAKLAESRADEIVREARVTARRIPGMDTFCRILEIADDAADDLEETAFLAGLLAVCGSDVELPAPMLALSNSLVEAAQVFQRLVGAAQHVHRGGERETMRQFLEAVDRMVTIEHQTDEQERAVTAALVTAETDCRHLHLVSGIANHLEAAADALLRGSLMLRDHVMGEVMFA